MQKVAGDIVGDDGFKTRDDYNAEINFHNFKIMHHKDAIEKLANKAIKDFHFLNHKVSNFWDCDKSPIGKCVWDISKEGFNISCRCYYCGQPVERK